LASITIQKTAGSLNGDFLRGSADGLALPPLTIPLWLAVAITSLHDAMCAGNEILAVAQLASFSTIST
jgi:hypothetical protein